MEHSSKNPNVIRLPAPFEGHVHIHRATPIDKPDLRQRMVEELRGYAAAAAYYKRMRRMKKSPKSVKFMTIDEHDDKWGQTDNCIYRITETGEVERFPFNFGAGMALEMLTRGRDE